MLILLFINKKILIIRKPMFVLYNMNLYKNSVYKNTKDFNKLIQLIRFNFGDIYIYL